MNRLDIFSRKPSPAKLDNGQPVTLRRLSAGDKLSLMGALEARKDGEADIETALDVHAQALALALADEAGLLYFEKPDEVLATLDLGDVSRLGVEVLKVNGILGGDDGDPKAGKPDTSGSSTV